MNPGPRQKLSDYVRKRNKQVANARLNKNRNYIGDQWIGGQGLKPSLVWTQSFEVAKLIIFISMVLSNQVFGFSSQTLSGNICVSSLVHVYINHRIINSLMKER